MTRKSKLFTIFPDALGAAQNIAFRWSAGANPGTGHISGRLAKQEPMALNAQAGILAGFRSQFMGLTMCEVSPSPLVKRRNVPASEMLPAAREVAVFIKSIDKRAASQSPRHRENFYRGDAFVVLEGQKIVLHYPNVPRADCVQIMQQLDVVVTAIGVEGHSPGWRYTVTPDIAAADCSAPVDQLNFWVK